MKYALSLIFCAVAWAAVAQDVRQPPALYSVIDVADDDTLNIRENPRASARILGAFEPDTRDIEVVGYSDSLKWGKVNVGEAQGWVAMKYLAPQEDVPGFAGLPLGYACFGTEPFWGFTVEADRIVFDTPDQPDGTITPRTVKKTGFGYSPTRLITGEWGDKRITAYSAAQGACGDGMSDREYGLTGTLLIETENGASLLEGCCSLNSR